ncbi:MAG: hypothetical protein AB1700_18690, partial [Bacillota bacterium]
MKLHTPYVHRGSPVHRLNPLTKGTLFLCVVTAAFASPSLTVVVSLFGAVLVAAAISRVTHDLIRMVVKSALLIVVLMFIVQGLFFP